MACKYTEQTVGITKPANAPPDNQQLHTESRRYRRPETQPTTNFASYP